MKALHQFQILDELFYRTYELENRITYIRYVVENVLTLNRNKKCYGLQRINTRVGKLIPQFHKMEKVLETCRKLANHPYASHQQKLEAMDLVIIPK